MAIVIDETIYEKWSRMPSSQEEALMDSNSFSERGTHGTDGRTDGQTAGRTAGRTVGRNGRADTLRKGLWTNWQYKRLATRYTAMTFK